MNKFVHFLTTELHNRSWSMRELSRRITFSAAQISNVIAGQAQPDADFVIAVANGLHTDPVTLLRLAGHLPPTADQARAADPALDEIITCYKSLPRHLQNAAILMLYGLCGTPTQPQPTAQQISPNLLLKADNAPQIEPTKIVETISNTGGQQNSTALEAYAQFFDNYPIEEVERVSTYFIALLQNAIELRQKTKINEDLRRGK